MPTIWSQLCFSFINPFGLHALQISRGRSIHLWQRACIALLQSHGWLPITKLAGRMGWHQGLLQREWNKGAIQVPQQTYDVSATEWDSEVAREGWWDSSSCPCASSCLEEIHVSKLRGTYPNQTPFTIFCWHGTIDHWLPRRYFLPSCWSYKVCQSLRTHANLTCCVGESFCWRRNWFVHTDFQVPHAPAHLPPCPLCQPPACNLAYYWWLCCFSWPK